MNNLWEQSNIQANCELCGVDEPFYMPIGRQDLINLRLQIPYYLVTQNSGGLPIGASVRLGMTDEAGTVICDLGLATANNYLFSRYNNTTTKKAEYQFYIPQPFKDENGINYGWKYVDVNEGQHLLITGTGTDADCEFTYGVDDTPAVFYEIKNGRLAFPFESTAPLIFAYLDGVPATITNLFNSPTCAFEDFDCFRVTVQVQFSVSGVIKQYFSKPMRIERCEDTIKIRATYPSLTTDCNGYIHDGTFSNPIADTNILFIRMVGNLNRSANRVKKTYNNKCFSIKGERTPMYKLNTPPVPTWFAQEVENLLIAKETEYNNVPLLLQDTDQLFQEQGVPGYTYQHLDISLNSCKCEITFSC